MDVVGARADLCQEVLRISARHVFSRGLRPNQRGTADHEHVTGAAEVGTSGDDRVSFVALYPRPWGT